MLRIDTTIVNFLPDLVALDIGEVAPNRVNKQLVPFYVLLLYLRLLFVIWVIMMSWHRS